MSTVYGKCPKCGQDIVSGQYGPYCVGKCGFRPGKIFYHELSEKELEDLLAGKEILLKNLESKTKPGKKYDMYVKMIGVREYTFTKKDGTPGKGFDFELEKRFPDRPKNDSKAKEETHAAEEVTTEENSETSVNSETQGTSETQVTENTETQEIPEFGMFH